MIKQLKARQQLTIGQLAGAGKKNDFINPFGGMLPPSTSHAGSIAGLYVNLSSTLGQLNQGWEALLKGPSLLEQMGGLQGMLPGGGFPPGMGQVGQGLGLLGAPGSGIFSNTVDFAPSLAQALGLPSTGAVPGMNFMQPGVGLQGTNFGGAGLSIPPLMFVMGQGNNLNLPIAGTRVSSASTAKPKPAPAPKVSRPILARFRMNDDMRGAR